MIPHIPKHNLRTTLLLIGTTWSLTLLSLSPCIKYLQWPKAPPVLRICWPRGKGHNLTLELAASQSLSFTLTLPSCTPNQ